MPPINCISKLKYIILCNYILFLLQILIDLIKNNLDILNVYIESIFINLSITYLLFIYKL